MINDYLNKQAEITFTHSPLGPKFSKLTFSSLDGWSLTDKPVKLIVDVNLTALVASEYDGDYLVDTWVEVEEIDNVKVVQAEHGDVVHDDLCEFYTKYILGCPKELKHLLVEIENSEVACGLILD
tara:strand:+ start:517 stop:891 length:375 start_codon:yes stop_codon:yes gene_type:complete